MTREELTDKMEGLPNPSCRVNLIQQVWEIMNSETEELKKENAELKTRLQKKINTTTVSDYPYSALKLEEAKEIIRALLKWEQDRGITDNLFDKDPKLKAKAEQFLEEEK